LRENKSRLSKEGMVVRTVLFTDGCPTAGNTNKDYLIKLCDNAPVGQITTMGYGNSEYSWDLDLDLLQNMSNMGKGNSYYMKDPDTCTRAFAYELAGLLTTVGQSIRIEVQPTKHIEIIEILDECDCEERNGSAIINIPDIISEEERYLMVKFKTMEQDKVFPRMTKIANVVVEYYNLEGQKVSDECKIKLNFVKKGNEDKFINKDVDAHLAILESIKCNKLAYEEAQCGNYSRANDILTNLVVLLTSVNHPRTTAEAERQKRINTLYKDKEIYAKSANTLSAVNYSNVTFGGSTRGVADPFVSSCTLSSYSEMYDNFIDSGSSSSPCDNTTSDNCVPIKNTDDNIYTPDVPLESNPIVGDLDWDAINKLKNKKEDEYSKITKKSDTVRF